MSKQLVDQVHEMRRIQDLSNDKKRPLAGHTVSDTNIRALHKEIAIAKQAVLAAQNKNASLVVQQEKVYAQSQASLDEAESALQSTKKPPAKKDLPSAYLWKLSQELEGRLHDYTKQINKLMAMQEAR